MVMCQLGWNVSSAVLSEAPLCSVLGIYKISGVALADNPPIVTHTKRGPGWYSIYEGMYTMVY